MGKIEKLVPKVIKKQEGVVTTLEGMTKLTQTESLTAVAIVAVDAEGRIWTTFEPGENLSLLIGAVAHLQRRIVDYTEE